MRRGRGVPLRRGANPGKPSIATPVIPDRSMPPGGVGRHRDSDASMCSSRPSSVGAYSTPAPSQSNAAMLRAVNAYLASHNLPITLKPPLPSSRDIAEAVRFIFAQLDWPASGPAERILEEELPHLLKHVGCPFKVNKSALKAPGTPHAWPSFIAALHLLVQLARYHDSINADPTPFGEDNNLFRYIVQSYSLFIEGDDDAVEALDQEHLRITTEQADSSAAAIEKLEKEAAEREAQLQALRSAPTPKETLEKERAALIGDVEKFQAIVESFTGKVTTMEEGLSATQEELQVKEAENQRICEENEELRKRVDSQAVDVRDADRMRKELQAVERDIEEAKMGRNNLEEKTGDLDVSIGRKLKELVEAVDQCNEAVRKLKLGSDFQYILNTEESSAAEVLGTTYKSVLKPALNAFAEDTKKSYVEKIGGKIALQQQSQEQTAMLNTKKEHLATLQAKAAEAESRSRLIKKEIEDHASLCDSEAKRMVAEVEGRMQQLEIVEKEAEEFLMDSEKKLQETIRLSEEGIQMCARELLELIDLVSGYKEYMESTISGMKGDLSEIMKSVAEAHKASLSSMLTGGGANSGFLSSKRICLTSDG